MENNTSQEIFRFLSRAEKWIKTAQYPICFLNLDREKNEIQVVRWGRHTRPGTECYYFWKKLNLKSYVLMDDIEEAVGRWSKFNPTFSAQNSDYPPVKEKLLPISGSYYRV